VGTRKSVRYGVALLAALGASGCTPKREAGAMEQASTSIACSLSVPAQVRAGEPLMLRFRLTNRTAQPLYVLDWHTPLEGLLANMLRVRHAGQELAYRGPMMKRGDPEADDYRALAPGASVEEEIDVSLAYDTDAPGRYAIAFRGPLMDVATGEAEVPRPLAQHQAMKLLCNEVETERL
jgi:peptidyl-Lys metalloendopeptidase